MRIIPRPSGLIAPAATVSGESPGAGGALTHGQEFTISGSGFGTRPDYNDNDVEWMGHRHMHHGALLDFANGFASPGSSKATWQALWYGFFPAGGSVSGYNFNSDPVGDDGVTLENGGPSQSGKFFRKTTNPGGFAEGGYVQIDKTNLTPCDGYTCFKHRGEVDPGAKIYRQHQENGGGDWFMGTGGAFLDGAGWPYDATASTDAALDPVNFTRMEIVMSVADGTLVRIDDDQLDFGVFIGGNPSGVDRPILVNANQNGLLVNCTWPNSVDDGFFDVTDIYIDQTAARVELWNTAGTIREIQLCKSWSDTSIVIACNRGELSLGAVKIKVIGADNAVISTIDGTLE